LNHQDAGRRAGVCRVRLQFCQRVAGLGQLAAQAKELGAVDTAGAREGVEVEAFWFMPLMTLSHLLFALVTTACILMAIQWEERGLIDLHGEDYVNYRRRVLMLLPRLLRPAPRRRVA